MTCRQCQRDQQCAGGMRCCKVVVGQIHKQCWAPCRRLMEPCRMPTDCVAGLVCGPSGVCHKPGQPLL
ncbi:hypothetical protein AAVH_24392 [Aphelenchoides avenae]|nr:hypothetical protein AAVH_24392 [Aphelenchus avenae]